MDNARSSVRILGLYGLSHGIVDATCCALLFASLSFYDLSASYFFTLVLAYNLLAFGTQPFIGLYSDRLQKPRLVALAGIFLLILSLAFYYLSPLFTMLLLGFGNALFHIGAGTVSLNILPRKATAPGIFVAPGAIGLLIGGLYGRSAGFSMLPLLVLLLLCFFFVSSTRIPDIDYKKGKRAKNIDIFELIILFLLLSVAIRAFVGSVIVFPWKSNFLLMVFLTLGVFFGKSLGGLFADRFGWIKVGVSSLVISSLLLSLWAGNPFLGILGMFLFNMTMPITLVAISDVLPGRPGFSFGLTTLALICGAFPMFIKISLQGYRCVIVLMMVLLSAIFLFLALRKRKR